MASVAAWVAIWRPDRRVADDVRVGTGVVTQTMCSEVFVAGLDPERVKAEELPTHVGLWRRLHVEVDRRRRRAAVDAAASVLQGPAGWQPLPAARGWCRWVPL